MSRRKRLLYFRLRAGKLESRRLYVADWRNADLVMSWIGFSREVNHELFQEAPR